MTNFHKQQSDSEKKKWFLKVIPGNGCKNSKNSSLQENSYFKTLQRFCKKTHASLKPVCALLKIFKLMNFILSNSGMAALVRQG